MANQISEQQIRAIATAIENNTKIFMPKLHEVYDAWDNLMDFKKDASEKLFSM